jgi:hypothetical protein
MLLSDNSKMGCKHMKTNHKSGDKIQLNSREKNFAEEQRITAERSAGAAAKTGPTLVAPVVGTG